MSKSAVAELNLKVLSAQPLNDWVLVKLIEEEQKGDIVIPDSAKERSQIAKVVAVGEFQVVGHEARPIALHVGDTILINRFGMDVEIEGEKFQLIKAAECYLRFPDECAN